MSFIREHIVKRFTRSKGWRKVRNNHIKEHPYCAVCGKTKRLEAHHIEDFSTNPELELDPDNLITLCRGTYNCHLLFGHLCLWQSINPDVVDDSDYMLVKIENRR